MTNQFRNLEISRYLLIVTTSLFFVAGLIIFLLVNHHSRQWALTEAEEKIRIILDRNLATHTYFSHKLKPTLFKMTDRVPSEEYFDPVWMSSTYAIREIDKYFRTLNSADYYYKECAVNARSPENEADPYEKAFLRELNTNPGLQKRSEIRVIDGKAYFVTLRRGEVMEETCLTCHSTPEKAPEGLVALYDRERSFHRDIGEVVSAISIRVPLPAAFASANRFSFQLSALLLIVLVFLYVIQIYLNRRFLLEPLAVIREKALEISTSEEHLGEEIPLCSGRELKELTTAFNTMSISLRQNRDLLDDRVRERTAALAKANEQLKLEIEQRMQADGALRESEKRFRTVFEAAPLGIATANPEGRFVEVNRAFFQMLDYTKEDAMSMTFLDITHPDDREETIRLAGEVHEGMRNSYQTQKRYLRKNGQSVWAIVRATAIRDRNQEIQYWIGIMEDITERVRAEEALRGSEEKYRELYDDCKRDEEIYRSILHTSADAIVVHDMEGNTRYVNPSFTKIFGWTMEELEGKRIPFVPEPEREATAAAIKEVIEEGRAIQGFETKRYTKDGRIIDVNASGSRYIDHEGIPSGMLVILRDTSEKKRLEAQLQQAQKMEAMGTLAGGIAHNFNNLLMSIQGNTSLMLLDIDSSHPHFEGLKNIEESVKNGSELARQLLGFARGGRYEVKATNLNELVDNSFQMLGRTKKEIRVHRKYQEDIWTAELDQGQIQQVLLNLYINAWQAMSGGGDLYIETANVTLDADFVKPHQVKAGRYVRVSVTDTGAGMDRATQERVFEPFFTSKKTGKGTGLGLASAYGFIKNHSGIIDVSSEKGKGTAFNVYLPASEKEVIEESVSPEEVVGGKETVLFVDDEDEIVEIGAKMLRKLGYTVLAAKNGNEAVETYEANKEKIDLVILDMIMPHISGGETYEMLKKINSSVRVLLSSGYSVEGQATDILERGCDGFIQKPFRVTELAEEIRKVLNKKPHA